MTPAEQTKLDKVRQKADPFEQLIADIQKRIKQPTSIKRLSSIFDRGVAQIERAIEELQKRGFNVTIADEEVSVTAQQPGGNFRIDPKRIHGNKIRFGALGDTHLGSKYERLDVLNSLYDWFREEGLEVVYHSGNMIDGRKAGINEFDLLPGCESFEGQLNHCAKNYPQRKGIETHFIAGDDHEGWWSQKFGINVGLRLQQSAEDAGRKDLKYLSYMEADLRFPAEKGETWGRVLHPGGGSAYATSYTAQKIVESYSGGEKPAFLLIGHYHKMEYGRPREVCCWQTGCTQSQTPFMRKKRLDAMLGGWIIELEQAPDGHIARAKMEDRRYFDQKFYERKEKFARW